jgi:hypothetical protein
MSRFGWSSGREGQDSTHKCGSRHAGSPCSAPCGLAPPGFPARRRLLRAERARQPGHAEAGHDESAEQARGHGQRECPDLGYHDRGTVRGRTARDEIEDDRRRCQHYCCSGRGERRPDHDGAYPLQPGRTGQPPHCPALGHGKAHGSEVPPPSRAQAGIIDDHRQSGRPFLLTVVPGVVRQPPAGLADKHAGHAQDRPPAGHDEPASPGPAARRATDRRGDRASRSRAIGHLLR